MGHWKSSFQVMAWDRHKKCIPELMHSVVITNFQVTVHLVQRNIVLMSSMHLPWSSHLISSYKTLVGQMKKNFAWMIFWYPLIPHSSWPAELIMSFLWMSEPRSSCSKLTQWIEVWCDINYSMVFVHLYLCFQCWS